MKALGQVLLLTLLTTASILFYAQGHSPAHTSSQEKSHAKARLNVDTISGERSISSAGLEDRAPASETEDTSTRKKSAKEYSKEEQEKMQRELDSYKRHYMHYY